MKSAVVMFSMLILGAALLADERPEPYPWLQDLGKARELAKTSGRPLLITFRCEP